MNDTKEEYIRSHFFSGSAYAEHLKKLPHSVLIELIQVGLNYETHYSRMCRWLRDEIPNGEYDAIANVNIGGYEYLVAWFSDLSQAVEFKLRWSGTIE